ncbi:DUF1048 domain-containing protein [Gordonia neofelifaecis]|uniref:DUF1048 domain-containing protein n=1 Tax=Gordonia neofelifaecis NRRL B-59395 TaxID=644548 RepID=F1YNL2_9ACTN|nr:DUF1048 domain-containing protein [Gordonia neofelifaecis]EGD53749.1 hypothetical protein SCNU_17470 [Gordonia neofelifaecis NRRL B-59395]
MFVTKMLDDKRRYREFKAHKKALPRDYEIAVDAIERYMMYFGSGTADAVLDMLADLIEVFEQGVADGTPIRTLVGDDPVDFAETLLQNYPEAQWIGKERRRLADAIVEAEAVGDPENGAPS